MWVSRFSQVRLPSGDRIQAELNDSHTVADLTKVSSGPCQSTSQRYLAVILQFALCPQLICHELKAEHQAKADASGDAARYGSASPIGTFELKAGFPHVVLDNPSMTVAQAGLANATVTVHFTRA
jgi:hypothetical protein